MEEPLTFEESLQYFGKKLSKDGLRKITKIGGLKKIILAQGFPGIKISRPKCPVKDKTKPYGVGCRGMEYYRRDMAIYLNKHGLVVDVYSNSWKTLEAIADYCDKKSRR